MLLLLQLPELLGVQLGLREAEALALLLAAGLPEAEAEAPRVVLAVGLPVVLGVRLGLEELEGVQLALELLLAGALTLPPSPSPGEALLQELLLLLGSRVAAQL